MKHPIEKILEGMNDKDRQLAELMYENGFSDEDLYAALSKPAADKILTQEQK